MSQVLFKTRCISSLTKVFADEELQAEAFQQGSALKGETYSYQVAYYANCLLKPLHMKVESALDSMITMREVGLVPSELPCHHDYDDNVLRTTPGLYPDPLYPISKQHVALPNQWRAVWITVKLEAEMESGCYPITLLFSNSEGLELGREKFKLDVIDAQLPPQQLIHTEWFHADCIATYYQVEALSEQHWAWMEMYVRTASQHGINMILTPLFTLPLDTEIGGERPTVQLVGVIANQAVDSTGIVSYQFDFTSLERWLEMCDRNGIQYFEMSHLFTQWGAYHAPKIMATVAGEYKQIFGWETDAAGEAYSRFLEQLLPELVRFIDHKNIRERCYFHVSDEPELKDFDQYKVVSELLQSHLAGFHMIDAISNYEFYASGLVKIPIPSNDHIEPFIEHEVEPLWTYYCIAQRQKVSNRFFNMPSARNRVIGLQLYKYNIRGFLHWAYNFWFAQFSKKAINPFISTDADRSFCSGDAYLVYPGEEGPIESIRLEVLYEALQDIRALELLESYIGKEAVIQLIEQDLSEPLTFSEYPASLEWLLQVREHVNAAIKAQVLVKQ